MLKKFALTWLSVFFLLSLSTLACELESDEEYDGGDGYTEDGTTDGADGDVDELKYFSIKVLDLTDDCRENSPGADIDAIELNKGGSIYYAVSMEDMTIEDCDGMNNTHTDSSDVLGAPDAQSDSGFLSLGGMGGYVMVEFGGQEIETGNTINIFEVGPSIDGHHEESTLEIQVISSSGNAVPIGLCEEGTCAMTVGVL